MAKPNNPDARSPIKSNAERLEREDSRPLPRGTEMGRSTGKNSLVYVTRDVLRRLRDGACSFGVVVGTGTLSFVPIQSLAFISVRAMSRSIVSASSLKAWAKTLCMSQLTWLPQTHSKGGIYLNLCCGKWN